jgi:hypothetical protein
LASAKLLGRKFALIRCPSNQSPRHCLSVPPTCSAICDSIALITHAILTMPPTWQYNSIATAIVDPSDLLQRLPGQVWYREIEARTYASRSALLTATVSFCSRSYRSWESASQLTLGPFHLRHHQTPDIHHTLVSTSHCWLAILGTFSSCATYSLCLPLAVYAWCDPPPPACSTLLLEPTSRWAMLFPMSSSWRIRQAIKSASRKSSRGKAIAAEGNTS